MKNLIYILALVLCFSSKAQNKDLKTEKNNGLEIDGKLLYKNILGNNQVANFTGIGAKDNKTLTNALLIKSIDSSSIEYRIETLVDWKSQKDKKGIAVLDTSSLNSEKWKIKNKDGGLEPVFRFVDKRSNCIIEILISKKDYKNSISIVNEICNGKSTLLTAKMRYK